MCQGDEGFVDRLMIEIMEDLHEDKLLLPLILLVYNEFFYALASMNFVPHIYLGSGGSHVKEPIDNNIEEGNNHRVSNKNEGE